MFYPDKKSELRDTIHGCFMHGLGPGSLPPAASGRRIFGAILPHAGYMYSGPVACHSVHAVSGMSCDLFVIVGPNHRGVGRDVATMSECIWSTPLGDVEVDHAAASEISEYHDMIEPDFFSHAGEHSIEVILPMLQEACPGFRMVPISMMRQDHDAAGTVGAAIAGMARSRNALVLGSSDFTHYAPSDVAYSQDMALIGPILDMDVGRFYDVLESRNVSACGYGAIAAVMTACKMLGASRGELLKYATSGDVTGDMSSVVGYGSIVFT